MLMRMLGRVALGVCAVGVFLVLNPSELEASQPQGPPGGTRVHDQAIHTPREERPAQQQNHPEPTLGLSDPLQDQFGQQQEHAEQHGEEAEHEAHALEYRNELALILAGTNEALHEEEGRVNLFTIGVEYEHRFDELFGAGVAAEHLSEKDAWLFVFLGYLHLWKGLKLLGGPGFERLEEHGETETEFVFRIGGAYALEYRRLAVTPTLALDFVGREAALVYGVNIGVLF